MLANQLLTTINQTIEKMCLPVENTVIVKRNESYIRVLLLSSINGSYLFPNLEINQTLAKLVEYGLLYDGFLDYYHKNSELINSAFEPYSDFSKKYSIEDLSKAYSDMLSMEMHASSNSTNYDRQKDRRDAAGAYYTPNSLSESVVKHTIRDIEKSCKSKIDFQNANIIDPSCGCGEFLISVKKELCSHCGISEEEAANRLYGVDTDPVAIQITVIRIFSNIQLPNQEHISNHFHIGNALYPSSNSPDADLAQLYVDGRIYSPDYGVLNAIMNKKYEIVIGNPPWEKIRFEDRKFFRQYSSPIADITKKDGRSIAIESIKKTQPQLYSLYLEYKKDFEVFKKYALNKGIFTKSTCGELNTYSLFTELSLRICSTSGIVALILKSAIMTSPVNSRLFNWLRKEKNLSEVFFFDNSKKIFDIDSREQFCIAFFYPRVQNTLNVSFGNTSIGQLSGFHSVELSERDIKLINPETCLLPGLNSNAELSFLKRIYSNNSTFAQEFPDCHFGRLVHLTLHANSIFNEPSESTIPILEGKMIGQYTSNYSTFSTVDADKKYLHKSKSNLSSVTEDLTSQCRYHIDISAWKQISKNYNEPYSLVWRDLTSSSNSRTMIATIVRHMPSLQSVQLLQCKNIRDLLLILGIFNSKAFDYILRSKLSGIDLTQKIIIQMPVPKKEKFETSIDFKGKIDSIWNHIIRRVAFLLPTIDFGIDLSSLQPNSAQLIEDIDWLVASTYGITNDEYDAIVQSF
ncbi:Eco57I restriction-modification methylase domain-containing protein [Methanomethylophilus alvi]|uniref:Eco57I restriction-modification methylase domain-containing protein n=1 Tax=Methanomethylophilus alvi TaxID=1291540 RepID=UPI0037DD10A6